MHLATVTLCFIISIAAFAGQVVSDDDVDADYYFSRGQHYDGEQNFPEAAKWYLKAAELGHSGAQSSLSALYFRGAGVPQDDAEALKWARMAADQGFAEAQANIGYLYHIGRALPQNHAEAEKWYLMAANQNFFNAMMQLARLHDDQGQYVEALAWAWVALTLSRDVYEQDAAKDLRTEIARRDSVTNENIDQAEALANSLLQDIP